LKIKVFGDVVLLIDVLILRNDSGLKAGSKPSNELLAANFSEESKLFEHANVDLGADLTFQMHGQLLYKVVNPSQIGLEVKGKCSFDVYVELVTKVVLRP